MTWLHFLNDCAEIDKTLNASISRAPAPRGGTDHTGRNRGVSKRVISGQWLVVSGAFREQASA